MKTVIWNEAHTLALVFDITAKDVTQYSIILDSGATMTLAQIDEEIKHLQDRMQKLFHYL